MDDFTYSRIQAEEAGKGEVRPLKVVLARPSYDRLDPTHAKHTLAAVMHSAAHGVQWVGDVSPHRMLIDGARNAAVEGALESGADGIVWIDDDIIMDPDHITRLLSYGKEFISGVYFQRVPPHNPLVTIFDPNVDSFRFMVKWPKDVLFEADGIGFGFCYTSLNLIRKIKAEVPEVAVKGEFFKFTKFSEDYTFCRYAARVGYRPFVDTGILLGHMGEPQIVTVDDFRAVNPYQEGTAMPLVPTNPQEKSI